MNNLYWIYIDYFIRMSTSQDNSNKNTSKFQLTDADMDDSSDNEMPAFAVNTNTTDEGYNASSEGYNASSEGYNASSEGADSDNESGTDINDEVQNSSSEGADSDNKSGTGINDEVQNASSERTNASSEGANSDNLSVTGIDVQDTTQYLYINTYIQGLFDGVNDVLTIELTSPDNNILFYRGDHDPEDATQKKLIAYIFLFAKTVKKIADSVGRIDTLLDDNTKVKEVEKELDILHGLLEVIYNLPLQYNTTYLLADLHKYFAEKPRGVIQDNKINIVFETSDGEQKNWDEFKKKYLEDDVYRVYKKGTVNFAQGQQAEKRLKDFEKKYIEPSKQSMMSSMGSFFRGKNRTGGNKKQTRRQLQKPNRRTRRK